MSDNLIKWLGLSLGWGFVACGALILLRALFADRSRGRRRCPRCWYLMTGVPTLQCPECGHDARRERRLFRTRRRWRRALAGAAIVLLGLVAMSAADVIRLGWVKGMPTTLLLLVVPVDSSRWEGKDVAGYVSVFRSPIGMGPAKAAMTPSAAVPWRAQIADELFRRVTTNELRRWQGDFLAARLCRARQARGETITPYNCSDLLRDDWAAIPGQTRVMPLPDLGALVCDVAQRIDNAPLVLMLSLSKPPPGGNSVATTRIANLANRSTRGDASFADVALHASWLGPLLFLRNAPGNNDVDRLLTALRTATPATPAALDEPQWQTRRALIERLRTTTLTLKSSDASIQDAFDAVTDATGIPIRPDWESLYKAGIGQDDPTAPGQLKGTAADILNWVLHWIEHRNNLIFRWTVTDDAVVLTSPDTVLFNLPELAHSLVRVYDARDILAARLRADPTSTLPDQETALLTGVDLAALRYGWYRVDSLAFSGRLIIRTQPAVHLAIEEYLNDLPLNTPR